MDESFAFLNVRKRGSKLEEQRLCVNYQGFMNKSLPETPEQAVVFH